MPSADFCHAIRSDRSSLSGSVHTWQTSRGKAQSFHGVNARFIKYTPIAEGGLRGHVPTRPGCTTPRIGFLFVAPPLWIELPPDPTSRWRPCPSPSLRLCEHLAGGLSPP